MTQEEKIDSLVEVSKKYKIDEPKPYARVEYWDSVSNKTQVVEFGGDDKVSGWEYSGIKSPSRMAWFLLGMAYATLLCWVAIWIWRFK